MTYIGDYIIQTLEEQEYPCSVTVRDYYKVQKITPPLITVQEIATSSGVELDNQPMITRNTFQIEVLAKAKVISGKTVSGIDLAKAIIQIADKAVNTEYGLTMNGDVTVAPYSDPTVTRILARYTVYIDERTNYLYRRI